MPGNILNMDTGFPEISGKDQSQINREILDYLSMLQEQLRYSMGNLGMENFNSKELDSIANYIREPVYVQLENEAGDLLRLSEQAEGIIGRISDAEGNINNLTLTANGLTNELSDAEGNINTLTETAEGILERLSDAEGNLTSLSAAASGLSASVSDLDGRMTTAEQTAGMVHWLIQDGTDATNFTLTSRTSELVSQAINIKGYVTIQNIGSPGKVEIDGGNLKAGTVQADKLDVDDLFAIHAKIGGWTIADASGLVYEDDTRSAGIRPNNSDSVIYIGKRANKNAPWQTPYPFYVSADGQLHAEDAYIVGEVHATSGEFTGTVHANDGEFTGTVNAKSGVFQKVEIDGDSTFKGTLDNAQGSIKGADIYGSAFHDLSGVTTLKLSPYSNSGVNSASLNLSSNDGSDFFTVSPVIGRESDGAAVSIIGADVRLKGHRVLRREQTRPTGSGILDALYIGDDVTNIFFSRLATFNFGAKFYGEVDFSGATVKGL